MGSAGMPQSRVGQGGFEQSFPAGPQELGGTISKSCLGFTDSGMH